MVSRRTRARIAFLTELLSIPLQVYQWRHATETTKSIAVVPRWLVVGGLLQAILCWAYDHDHGGFRTKWWRRVSLAIGVGIGGFRVLPRAEAVWRNLSIGGSLGRIGYRLWYGVLRPLPDTTE